MNPTTRKAFGNLIVCLIGLASFFAGYFLDFNDSDPRGAFVLFPIAFSAGIMIMFIYLIKVWVDSK